MPAHPLGFLFNLAGSRGFDRRFDRRRRRRRRRSRCRSLRSVRECRECKLDTHGRLPRFFLSPSVAT